MPARGAHSAMLAAVWFTAGLLLVSAALADVQVQRPFASVLEGAWAYLRNVSGPCGRAADNFTVALKNGTFWALEVEDSEGIPSNGILEGGVSSLGYYSECLASNRDNGEYQSRYCLVTLSTVVSESRPRKIPEDLWKILQTTPSKLAACLPVACTDAQVTEALINASRDLNWTANVTVNNCSDNKEPYSLDAAAIIMTCLFSMILLLMFLGTALELLPQKWNWQQCFGPQTTGTSRENLVVDELRNHQLGAEGGDEQAENAPEIRILQPNPPPPLPEPFLKRMLCCFSMVSNGKKILNMDAAQNANTIKALDGIRVLSIVWIIVGHSFSFAMQWLTFRNPGAMKDAPKSIFTQILANGTFSVDSFFFLSGFLVAFHALRQLRKGNETLNLKYVLTFYQHRILRLTPLMMAIIAFCATLLRHVASGPAWANAIETYDSWCRKNWWTNLLYLQNFIDREHMCLSHTWYSAVDTQLYLLAPLLLYFFHRGVTWERVSSLLALSITSIITIALTLGYDLPAVPYFNNITTEDLMNDYYGIVYIKPYCRAGPYIVGMLLGSYFARRKEPYVMGRWKVATLWFLTPLVALAILLAMYPVNQGSTLPLSVAALYSAFARTVWAACLAWLAFACNSNYGGVVGTFLSWRVFGPFSRLTYCAYLVHPIVIAVFYGSREIVFDFSVYFMIYFVIGNLVITYATSFLLSLAFESPIIRLEKLLKSKGQE